MAIDKLIGSKPNQVPLNQTLGTLAFQNSESLDSLFVNQLSLESGRIQEILQSKSITPVDVFVYDTALDSDGGLWRENTRHLSWYNESLNTLTRGNRKKFPGVAIIVAESNKVTIFDGDDPKIPMWMTFNTGTGTIFGNSNTASCIWMLNGFLSIGFSANSLDIVDFKSDISYQVGTTGISTISGTILERNLTTNVVNFLDDNIKIPHANVRDVAMKVFSGTSIPSIVVTTDGNDAYNTSLIKNMETSVFIGADSSTVSGKSVSFSSSDDSLLLLRSDGELYIWNDAKLIMNDGQSPSVTVSGNTLNGSVTTVLGTPTLGKIQ